jgi:hypothetical protein
MWQSQLGPSACSCPQEPTIRQQAGRGTQKQWLIGDFYGHKHMSSIQTRAHKSDGQGVFAYYFFGKVPVKGAVDWELSQTASVCPMSRGPKSL